MKSILSLGKLPLNKRPTLYVSPMSDGTYTIAVMDGGYEPKRVSLKVLRSFRMTVALWNPQKGTHRTIHTDDIG